MLCGHIFAHRRFLNEPLFTHDDVSPQHSLLLYVDDTVDSLSQSSFMLSQSARFPSVLSQSEKFKEAHVRLSQLADILSNLVQKEFECHLDMLINITDAIKRGKSIVWAEGDQVFMPGEEIGSDPPISPAHSLSPVDSNSNDSFVDVPSIPGSPSHLDVPYDAPSTQTLECHSPSHLAGPSDAPSTQTRDCHSPSHLDGPSDAPALYNSDDDFVPTSVPLPTQSKKRGRPKKGKVSASKKRKVTDYETVLGGILCPGAVSLSSVLSGSRLIDPTMLRDVSSIPGHVSSCQESLLLVYFTLDGWSHFQRLLRILRGNV